MIQKGESVFIFGHPEGLFFTMSSGIVSRKHSDGQLQVSAPVSPGNSGGPIFDTKGRLLGIVSSKVDKQRSPNAENLNFGVRADALLQPEGWNLDKAAATMLRGLSTQARESSDGPKSFPESNPDLLPVPPKTNQ
jgi:hypothetical protein